MDSGAVAQPLTVTMCVTPSGPIFARNRLQNRDMDANALAAWIGPERKVLIERWRQRLQARDPSGLLATAAGEHDMHGVLDELADELAPGLPPGRRAAAVGSEGSASTAESDPHDSDSAAVVLPYHVLRDCLHELADARVDPPPGPTHQVVDRVFDRAVGRALQRLEARRAAEIEERQAEYMGFVAHELRTPLFAISLAGRVLENSLPKRGYGPDSAQMLSALRRSVQQLEESIRRLLDDHPARRAALALRRREVALAPLLDALIDELQPIGSSVGTQCLHTVPIDLIAYTDAAALRQALQQCLADAMRQLPPSTLTVAATQADQSGPVDCRIEVAVARRGAAGAPPTTAPADGVGADVREPTWVGLQELAEAHGGGFSIEREAGAQASDALSVVRFWLPAKRHV